MKQIRWMRIVVGGFLSELAVIAVFVPATAFLGVTPGVYTAVGGSFVMPLVFGFLTARKVETNFVLHGALVGVVGIAIYLGLTRFGPEPLLYIVAHGLKLLGGAAGGYLAQRKLEQAIAVSPS
jgi:drug/metabolite transporter superfamily protein YnfA